MVSIKCIKCNSLNTCEGDFDHTWKRQFYFCNDCGHKGAYPRSKLINN